jgi:hypothetical protein
MNSDKPSRVFRWWGPIGLCLGLSAILPGCVAHARGTLVYDHEAEYVDAAPERVEYYPSTYYRGRPAYLIDGRWYYHSDRRWVVFRDEPRELRDYRVHRAPAYLRDNPGYRAPRQSETRYYDHRAADTRRYESRRLEERRAAERRAEARRDEQRRAAEHRAAEHRAEARRDEQRRAAERQAQDERHAAERRAHDSHQREKARRPRNRNDDKRDEADDRQRRWHND